MFSNSGLTHGWISWDLGIAGMIDRGRHKIVGEAARTTQTLLPTSPQLRSDVPRRRPAPTHFTHRTRWTTTSRLASPTSSMTSSRTQGISASSTPYWPTSPPSMACSASSSTTLSATYTRPRRRRTRTMATSPGAPTTSGRSKPTLTAA